MDYVFQNGSSTYGIFVDFAGFRQSYSTTPVLAYLQSGTSRLIKTASNTFVYDSLGVNYTGIIDLDAISASILNSGVISPVDTLHLAKLVMWTSNGTGSTIFDVSLSMGLVPYVQPILIGNFTFVLEMLFTNSSSLDYCNLSSPISPTLTQQVSLSYLYTNWPDPSEKCRMSCRTGYLNGTFYTPVGVLGLPIDLSIDYEFLSNLSMPHTPQLYPNGSIDTTPISAAICWILSTRKDFNSTTYTNTSNPWPSKEIFICPFWTAAYTRLGTYIRSFTYGDHNNSLSVYDQY